MRAATKEEAAIKAAIKLRDLEEGKSAISRNMLVSAWSREWLRTYKEPVVGRKQYKSIDSVISKFIIPSIGSMSLKSVKPVHLQKLLNGLSEYSDSYISKIYDIIRQIFCEAYRNDLLLNNPAETIKKPSGKKKKKRRAITAKERELTLKVADTYRGGTFVLLMLYCGLRPSEVAALIWKDVDLDNNIIHVRQALKSDGSVSMPKTDAGYRDVPIPAVLSERLSKERSDNPFELVCKNTQGRRYTSSSFQAMFEVFRNEMNKAAGCSVFRGQVQPPYAIGDDLTLYCYRHTYCTDLQSAGVPINVAKELMGHSSISVTAEIYTHKSEAAFKAAAEAIDAYQKAL